MEVATYLQSARKLAIGLMIMALPLPAQTGLGVVRGTVQDAGKAVIPNAKVILTNTETGVAHNAQTNSAGIDYFGSPNGPYSLTVEAQGFRKWEGTLTWMRPNGSRGSRNGSREPAIGGGGHGSRANHLHGGRPGQ